MTGSDPHRIDADRWAERRRITEQASGDAAWSLWGPYLSDRQWGTVREDYSRDGNAWRSLTFEDARSRAYRWGEDGIAGICDDHGLMCLSLSLWNGRDRILKERLFGLTNEEGNHGEDVKEVYHHLDAVPSHAYLKFLYHYPHGPFPYEELIAGNARRGRDEPEYEIGETGAFDEDRYFAVTVEYGKADADDLFMVVTAINRGAEPADLHLVPQLWFRNIWSWREGRVPWRPWFEASEGGVDGHHPRLGRIACPTGASLRSCSARTTRTCASMAASPRRRGRSRTGSTPRSSGATCPPSAQRAERSSACTTASTSNPAGRPASACASRRGHGGAGSMPPRRSCAAARPRRMPSTTR